MKQRKEFKYHLKKDVRDDLLDLYYRIEVMLERDDVGFDTIPSHAILPSLYRVQSHLVWCRKFVSWFKKVYE